MRLEAVEGGAGSQPLLGEDLSPVTSALLLPGTACGGRGESPSSSVLP